MCLDVTQGQGLMITMDVSALGLCHQSGCVYLSSRQCDGPHSLLPWVKVCTGQQNDPVCSLKSWKFLG